MWEGSFFGRKKEKKEKKKIKKEKKSNNKHISRTNSAKDRYHISNWWWRHSDSKKNGIDTLKTIHDPVIFVEQDTDILILL